MLNKEQFIIFTGNLKCTKTGNQKRKVNLKGVSGHLVYKGLTLNPGSFSTDDRETKKGNV